MMHAAKGVSQQNHTVGRGRVFRGPLFLLCRNVVGLSNILDGELGRRTVV